MVADGLIWRRVGRETVGQTCTHAEAGDGGGVGERGRKNEAGTILP